MLTIPTERAQPWLAGILPYLAAPRPQPAVLRHSRHQQRSRVEVRRWTVSSYVGIDWGDTRLLLDARAALFECVFERRRMLRQTPEELIYDDVFKLELVASPTNQHLRCVQQACLARCQPELYRLWSRLDPKQRCELVAYPAAWAQARMALADPDQQLDSLMLLLSEQAHPDLRMEVLEAGESGSFRPDPSVLSWLLAQPQWNQSPALVAMARSAAEGAQLSPLQSHPNALVRSRLVDLMPGDHDWIGWVAEETDPSVREALRRRIERCLNPSQLVSGWLAGADQRRGEALGWLLVGWSRRIDCSQDWGALNRALRGPIGRENRRKLKQKLSAMGRLSLSAVLL